MTVKVNILSEDDIRNLPTREVEIPDKCPGCGADLTEGCAIQERGFVWYSCDSHVEGDSIEGEGSFDECFDGCNPICAYVCTTCELELTHPSDATPGRVIATETAACGSDHALLAELDANIADYYSDHVDIEGFRARSAATWEKIETAGLHSAVLDLIRTRCAQTKPW